MMTMATKPLPPAHFFSHGSTMMLGEETESADYWKKCGDDALANGIERVVMMAHVPTSRSFKPSLTLHRALIGLAAVPRSKSR